MRQYAAKRIGLFIPTVLLVTVIVFVVMRLIPGDPALAILSADDAAYTEQELQELRVQLGTDRPIVVQYFDWMSGLLRGDFGTSFWWNGPVMDRLGERIPVTIELAVLGIALAVVCAVPLGVLSAIKPDSPLDYLSRIFTLVGISIPTFFSGILLTLVLIRAFGWLPPLGYEDFWEDPWANVKQMMLPALALGFYDMAFIARVTRSSMMEILREDYMRTARSKGLRERIVLSRHGLKNAVLPILTISGWQFGRLFGGTVIIERIFLIPGIGQLLIDAVFQRDFPTIQAIIVIVAVSIVVVNLLVDLLYGWLDPRIRYA
ncbi:Putative peptide transport system permease protein BMEII0209 [Geodia barretti]|uniref:Peptide transport system permease protein BMEII0209 n=1 Tax=Geodia barretti TaxID=519541 RepID=A0AA35R747_GEOBA|nr:Putative peptide transport system permease protein BMEII0209 [Geodia barretti]